MKLCRYALKDPNEPRLGIVSDDRVVDVLSAGGPGTLDELLNLGTHALQSLGARAQQASAGRQPLDDVTLLAPIDRQEVWAAGVTYRRSRDARMEESTQKDVYDLVYEADRPEIFFKATPNRVSGPGEPVAIRPDSTWDVPEPELALVLNARGDLVGFTVGNDVSSRSIEGANPLYLPQAKLYSRSAALGPYIVTADELSRTDDLEITLEITRDGAVRFKDQISTSQIHRPLHELSAYLFRANEFPHGVILMTGTGIVPPAEFTLESGDVVAITIEGIGALVNPVIRLEQ